MAMHALTPQNELRANEPEALLIRRAGGGDSAAFSELARMLARPALAQATRVLGDRALAEDAVQEAFTRLWREAGRYDPERGSFGGWWRRLLMNCVLDGRRRLKPVQPIEEAAHVPDSAPTPARMAESADLAARVQQGAAALPDRQRAALSLFHGDGLTMAEIADALETSEKAVEGLLLRGRATLKERLASLKDEWK